MWGILKVYSILFFINFYRRGCSFMWRFDIIKRYGNFKCDFF